MEEGIETTNQISPQPAADRAATLLLVDKLRSEEARIHAEIVRLTRELEVTADFIG